MCLFLQINTLAEQNYDIWKLELQAIKLVNPAESMTSKMGAFLHQIKLSLLLSFRDKNVKVDSLSHPSVQ